MRVQIEGREITFIKEKNIILSKNCSEDKKNCLALKKAKEIKFSVIQEKLLGGKNPGILLCHELKEEVVAGVTDRGQISFCRFKDKTMINTGGLVKLAQ